MAKVPHEIKAVKVSIHYVNMDLEPGMTMEEVKALAQSVDPEIWAVIGWWPKER